MNITAEIKRAAKASRGLLLLLLLSASTVSRATAQVDHGNAYAVYITNHVGYVTLHFITLPNKNNFLQAAWVYPTNVLPYSFTNFSYRYTNLMWSNIYSYPALPTATHIPPLNDYSVTNRVPNRYRIYRLRAT